ncbi:unnamed protein product [Rotaria socialis]|nr:unnamed protein product [Rotaria socialis]CAF3432749.1 unnamed protein product [Rotaria socialis]CAF3725198.1 unnamed protein product [Rotaria socialis]CAF4409075.1 unnamed protein product [Rotaria socialis]CAF4424906.1 unnamed protein product [Rotaria socialis]
MDINPSKTQNDMAKEYSKKLDAISRPRGISSSFIQSRYFHIDQFSRDNRDLARPAAYRSKNSPSYYTYGGAGTYSIESNQEGCRLKNNLCSHDYQCCSGKCRCVRWSVMGKMSCWKKCF